MPTEFTEEELTTLGVEVYAAMGAVKRSATLLVLTHPDKHRGALLRDVLFAHVLHETTQLYVQGLSLIHI